VPPPEQIESQVSRIKAAIARDGTFVATAENITALSQDRRFEEQFRLQFRSFHHPGFVSPMQKWLPDSAAPLPAGSTPNNMIATNLMQCQLRMKYSLLGRIRRSKLFNQLGAPNLSSSEGTPIGR
jgi:hypothetical protein